MDDYAAFLATKAVAAPVRGMERTPPLAKHLFRFQREAVAFGLRLGSWACFFSTGLGKTACELEWCKHAATASNGRALILTPLAVARQIEAEGRRWGYTIRVIREQAEVGDGINVCNYDRLDKLDLGAFGAVALDESSIVKSFDGSMSRALIAAVSGHRWRMAATATPAPNDHMELGQHAALLGIMPAQEMLLRWFVHDSANTLQWRLKRHGVADFWRWVASWARMASHPRDLDDDVPGFDLPPLTVHRHRIAGAVLHVEGSLFADATVSATDMHRVKRQTADGRAAAVTRIVTTDPDERWIIWCDTDYEADALMRTLPTEHTRDVRGSYTIERKESVLAAFDSGTTRYLVTKPSLTGFGLNWQFCAHMVFVGRTFSYEAWFQAVRRCWRFGQTRPVQVHLVVAEGEDHIGRVIDRKAADHQTMQAAMVAAMREALHTTAAVKQDYRPTHEGRVPQWMRPVPAARPQHVASRR